MPFAVDVKTPGAVLAVYTVTWFELPFTWNVAKSYGGVSFGMKMFSNPEDADSSGAETLSTVTDAPPSESGNGSVCAPAELPSPEPNSVTYSPGATELVIGAKLAEFTIPS